jgi:hypothetical protein
MQLAIYWKIANLLHKNLLHWNVEFYAQNTLKLTYEHLCVEKFF